MSLCEGSKIKVKIGSEFSEKFHATVGVHQGSVLSPLLFAVVVDVVTDNAREDLLKEVLYADELVQLSETMEGLKERFMKWRSGLESKELEVNLQKTKVMLCVSKVNM